MSECPLGSRLCWGFVVRMKKRHSCGLLLQPGSPTVSAANYSHRQAQGPGARQTSTTACTCVFTRACVCYSHFVCEGIFRDKNMSGIIKIKCCHWLAVCSFEETREPFEMPSLHCLHTTCILAFCVTAHCIQEDHVHIAAKYGCHSLTECFILFCMWNRSGWSTIFNNGTFQVWFFLEVWFKGNEPTHFEMLLLFLTESIKTFLSMEIKLK